MAADADVHGVIICRQPVAPARASHAAHSIGAAPWPSAGAIQKAHPRKQVQGFQSAGTPAGRGPGGSSQAPVLDLAFAATASDAVSAAGPAGAPGALAAGGSDREQALSAS